MFTHSSSFDAPVEAVFDWHSHPGALSRLTPPWQPVSVHTETDSLRDGRAVLELPGGLRWVAAHEPDGYERPHRFVDRLVSAPLATLMPWRHTHTFVAESYGRTRLEDQVETRAPQRLLRPMFAYRHRQLADDLAALDRYAHPPLTVAVTGSSGLVGSVVTALLSTGGHRVLRLVRRPTRRAGERHWQPEQPAPDLLTDVDVVVHLAGAGIAGRFTDGHKHRLRSSRIGPTRALAELAARTPDGPTAFVSASAIGYYGPDRGDDFLTEQTSAGAGFLADLVADWETAARPASEAGLRTVQVRTGIAQTPRGGPLRLQFPLFLAGLGGRLGNGRQWLSWIGIDDLADIYLRAVIDPSLSGPINAVAPNPVRNATYTRTLAEVLHRPAPLPIPREAPQLLLGEEAAHEFALADQRVHPERLLHTGHHFRHPTLTEAFEHVLGRGSTVDAESTR